METSIIVILIIEYKTFTRNNETGSADSYKINGSGWFKNNETGLT